MSEQFIHSDLGWQSRGQIVEFKLSGNQANVQLIDSANFSNYRNGRPYRAVGGRATKSLVRLQVPTSGHWHAVVDMRGLGGNVRAEIRLVPSPLPELREVPLSSVPTLVQSMPTGASIPDSGPFDVFISHASEDKEAIVRDLARALQDEELRVWYDEFELRIGDSLRRKIDHGLANSRVGLVVLSPAFVAKGWTNYELDGIVTRVMTGEQVLLPIWHNLTKAEVIAYSPSLADKVARSTATHTVEEIAAEIADLLKSS